MREYRILSHAEAGDRQRLIVALSDLEGLTFSHYDGVVHSTPSFLRWYLARPGMLPQLCQAAFADGQLVSSVFVTLAQMRLGGEAVLCGLVDTVMTHPDHRRHGLATKLLERVLGALENAGADVSLLYTARDEPVSPPERLYRGLGYEPRESVTRYVRPPGPISEGIPPAEQLDPSDRRPFERALAAMDGWLLLDEDLWRWRRIERPDEYPIALYATRSGAAAAICVGELIVSGAPRLLTVISDLVLPRDETARDELYALLSAAPSNAPVTILGPQSSRRGELLREVGFAAGGVEVAMIHPISSRGRAAAARPPGEWYVAIESVIGV
jgi:GNAT superfamily N-acetyltransferase